MEKITDSAQLIGKKVGVVIHDGDGYKSRKLINIEKGGLLFEGNEKDRFDTIFILNRYIEAIYIKREKSDVDNYDDDEDDF